MRPYFKKYYRYIFRYIFRYIYRYFLPRYMDRHSKRYFFGNGKYTVTPTVTAIVSTARLKITRYRGRDNFWSRVTGIVTVFYKRY